MKGAYQNANLAVNVDVDVDKEANSTVGLSGVVGYQGWLAGYQAAYDANANKLSKNNFALGFSTSDFILHTNV